MSWLGLLILVVIVVLVAVLGIAVALSKCNKTLPDDRWEDSLARTKGELPYGYYKKGKK